VLDAIAPEAERAAFPSGDAGARAMTAWVTEPRKLRAWVERRRSHAHSHDGDDAHAHAHHHGNQLVAVSFTDDAPLLGDRVLAVVEALGDRLVRAKGFIHLAGDSAGGPRRGFLERAGIRTELRPAGDWGDTPARTELVLIGDDLDEAAIHRALWACRAGN
jgi:G3E family GTPase